MRVVIPICVLLALACTGGGRAGDRDRDGVPADEDCDDDDVLTFPGAPDLVGDDNDQNCDGEDGVDADGDGVASVASGGTDCDDEDDNVHPGAPDAGGDGQDSDCDGTDGADIDGDGFAGNGGPDCDDNDPAVNPDGLESCNGVDDDCDGRLDNGTECFDDDGDGYSELDGDCNDSRPTVNPDMAEIPDDGVDNDCDGETDEGGGGDTALYEVGYTGKATVTAGVSYAGTETLYVDGVTDPTATLCRWTWNANHTSTPPSTPCPGCAWAFNVKMTAGKQTKGDCLAALGASPTDGTYAYGFHPTYAGGGPTMMYLYGVTWYPNEGSAAYDAASKVFEYRWPLAVEQFYY